MAKVQVRLKMRGIQKVLRDYQPELAKLGKEIADAAGPGFEMVERPQDFTARVYVQTANRDGAKRQAESAVLERAMGSVR
ncbi:hypothetical protein BWO91_06280 [Plantibacter flavus]|uniref:hypothetical protein n=1 Tax=Plantibacter flavus TaxID=150123 RepID=UPI00099E13CE|nr:hypothetical protein [Plantibacter flavus]AQX79647.1 hypothetical protein BWO91_06280 [Plantibacter flavus]